MRRSGWRRARRAGAPASSCTASGPAVSRCCSSTPAARSGPGATLGAWSIPKGEYEDGEEPLAAARREFEEELGIAAARGRVRSISARSARSPASSCGAWALAGDLDAERGHQQHVRRWSGRRGRAGCSEFPEVDRAEWFELDEAREQDQPGPGRAARPSPSRRAA